MNFIPVLQIAIRKFSRHEEASKIKYEYIKRAINGKMYHRMLSQVTRRKLESGLSGSRLVDNYGRRHDYLRISITERCNLRCLYCMPEEGIQLQEKASYLSLDEFKRITRLFVTSCGIKKIRITGGEPTIDRKLLPLIEHLNGLRENGLEIIAMTTNGLTLKRNSELYKAKGLDLVNISLDTLREERYEKLALRKGFRLAWDGFETALRRTKFERIKLNCVVMRSFNDDELLDFAKLAEVHPRLEVRFIEFMPFEGNNWRSGKLMSCKEMLDVIRSEYQDLNLVECSNSQRGSSSRVYKSSRMSGSIGFISSMSNNFCSSCNRLRVTADGQLKVCLFSPVEMSLKGLIRNGASDEEIVQAIKISVRGKKKEHGGIANILSQTKRPMIRIENKSQFNRMRYMHSDASNSDRTGSGGEDKTPEAGLDLSHVNSRGEAVMVNISNKQPVKRVAIAEGSIYVGKSVIEKIASLGKGDLMSVSKVAGLMGAKQTSQLIPMCHQISLDHVSIEINVCKLSSSLIARAKVETIHKTGVEMESLMAVSICLLTIYDMCKSINKSMIISEVRLISKVK